MQRTPQLDDLELPPDRYLMTGGSGRIRTMLGSGGVITLWNRARQIGAMAHFLPAQNGLAIPLKRDGHSGPDGLHLVLPELRFAQIDAADCVARICSGGVVVSHADHVPSLNSGQANGEFARSLLRTCGLPIVSESFYPMGRYQILFDVSTGRMQARRVKPVVVAIDTQRPGLAPHPPPEKRESAGAIAG